MAGSLAVQTIAAEPQLIESRRIWDQAPHCAFTDLTRFRDQWWCVFREGAEHVSPDGAVRVIVSSDGTNWASAARITSPVADLRDPKITPTPDSRLMLTAAGALTPPAPARHQTYAWFSADGWRWSEPASVGEPNVWLWRVVWAGDTVYGVGYDTTEERFTRLYRSADGRRFETVIARLFDQGYPNETGLAVLADRTLVCLLRRDGEPGSAQVGTSRPPYTDWQWKDLGVRIGGPHLLLLPDGRLLAGIRLYDGGARTSLATLDVPTGQLTEILRLPSGGDTSYPGVVWHEGFVWVSYYSSHEGRTAIYLARVRL